MTTPWLQDLHTIIFDLDGTLYQDDAFVERYLAHLVRGTPQEGREVELLKLAEDIFGGRHPLGVNDWYDAARDVCVAHDGERPVRVFDWDGRPVEWSGSDVPEAYGNAAVWAEEAAARRLHFAGDAWGVVGAIAARFRIPEEKRQYAFRRVREEMIAPPFGIRKHERLLAAVRRLPCRAMLLTNSPGDTAAAFSAYLGLDGAFAYTAYGSGKPSGIASLIERITGEERLPASGILSIGDNAWNDLLPARRAGCRTIAVAPYAPAGEAHHWDVLVRTLDELADWLEQLSLQEEECRNDGISHAGA